MTTLGIDTSARVCSVALMVDGVPVSEKTLSDGLTHSETLLPSVDFVLKDGKMTIEDLDLIGVSVGPGSFTGLRIGISTVKGLAIARMIPCVGVSTLEALAKNAEHREGKTVCPVMDARRGEFYNALFFVQNGDLVRLTPDRAISGEEIAKEMRGKDVLILGDGAEKFVLLFPDFRDCLAPEEIRYQSGASVARVAEGCALTQGTSSPEALFPKYLRMPQAEREWRKKFDTNQ